MLEIKGLQLSASIGVMYDLKEKNDCKTLQETYKLLETSEIDTIMDVLRISHNRATKKELTEKEFITLLEEKEMGFVTLTDVYAKLVEKLMFNGMSSEEVEATKKKLTKK